MRFEKINDNKLQIILSNDELPNSANLDEFVTDSDNAKDAFLGLLEQANEAVGFNTQDYKIRIDARAMINGDFVFTITRLIKIKNEKASVRPKVVARKTAKSSYTIYQFATFDDFEDFCDYLRLHKISNIKALCKSCVLYKYGNYFYLALTEVNDNYKNLALFNSSITEFSKFFSTKDLFIATLQEHGKVFIQDNAILTYQANF